MIMRALTPPLLSDKSGAAAAEMALIFPMLLTLMFGSMELGKFFLDQHVVVKGVRDAARYAARLPVSEYPECSSTVCEPSEDAKSATRRLARTGTTDADAPPRVSYWTSDSSVSVIFNYDTSGAYKGVYTDFPIGPPVVTVSAAVPYEPLFLAFALEGTFSLVAQSQASVFGA